MATESKGLGRARWGDRGDDDAPQEAAVPVASVGTGLGRFESKPDAQGIKTIVEYHRDENGKPVKITRKVKVTRKAVKENKHVLARRQWKKFGDCAGLPPGPEENITYVSVEKIVLDLSGRKKEEEGELFDKIKGTKESIVVCRFCGGTGHWTLKCPKRSEAQPKLSSAQAAETAAAVTGSGGNISHALSSAGAAGGKYVPPRLRAGGAATSGDRPGAAGGARFGDEYTLRVTNLSEDTSEGDLRELFSPFGNVQRIFLAKDKTTNVSRGFAFVNFLKRDDAQNAIDKLDGYGYDNLILHVEWAKPRDTK